MLPPTCLVISSYDIPDPNEFPPSDVWLEIRFDLFNEFDHHAPERQDSWLEAVIKVYDKVIITLRAPSWGEQRNEIRYLCYRHWVEFGVPYIDISFHEPFSEELIALCEEKGLQTQIILSHHIFDYNGNVQHVRHILQEMKKQNPFFAKIAVMCSKAAQAVELLTLYKEFPHDLIIAMGREGGFSRFAIPYLGAPYTYASYSSIPVPGLLPISLLKPIFEWWNNQDG